MTSRTGLKAHEVMSSRLPQGTHICQWCRAQHAGLFYELKPNEWYCTECAAERMYKAGQLPKSVLAKHHDQKMQAIEDVLDCGFAVNEIEVNNAVEELKQWIASAEQE